MTGPDEYSTVVDNNAYTNLMARENLAGAARRASSWLQASDPEAHARLVARDRAHRRRGRRVVRARPSACTCPATSEPASCLQDEHFLNRKPWDFEGTPAEHYPLLLHYHPLNIYRHQVIKQTDVVLATFLARRRVHAEEKRRMFDYYDPLTTGDSSLSACVQSIMASEVGDPDAALDYFLDACAIDLADTPGTSATASTSPSCGGTWMALVNGFAGLRDIDGDVRFDPRLPRDWERLRFRIQVRGQPLEVDMTHAGVAYRLLDGSVLLVHHRGEELRIVAGAGGVAPGPERGARGAATGRVGFAACSPTSSGTCRVPAVVAAGYEARLAGLPRRLREPRRPSGRRRPSGSMRVPWLGGAARLRGLVPRRRTSPRSARSTRPRSRARASRRTTPRRGGGPRRRRDHGARGRPAPAARRPPRRHGSRSRPGSAYEAFHAALAARVGEPASAWQRQMTLGPATEYCVLAGAPLALPWPAAHAGRSGP